MRLSSLLLYLFITDKEVEEEKQRLLTRYDDVKGRYKDLLNEDDLNKIIDTTKLKANDEEYIEKRRGTYKKVWKSFNIIIVIMVLVLYFIGRPETVSNDQPQPAQPAKPAQTTKTTLKTKKTQRYKI